jgi:alkylation response protein AidB-like acyl-CoA dehydrogenase
MMAAMDYLLTPEQKALKEAIRGFVALEVPSLRAVAAPDSEIAEALILKLGEFLREREGRPEIDGSIPLSGVETVMVLEEILKGLPAAGPEPAGGRLFEGLSPELRNSAALLGSAQGVLAPCFGRAFGRRGLEASGHDCRALDQELADVLSAIEAARLMTYRAAILEDEKRPDAEEATEAKRQAEELASRAADLAALIKKGEDHET